MVPVGAMARRLGPAASREAIDAGKSGKSAVSTGTRERREKGGDAREALHGVCVRVRDVLRERVEGVSEAALADKL